MIRYRYFRELQVGDLFLLGGTLAPRLRKTSDTHAIAADETFWEVYPIELCEPIDEQLEVFR